MEKIVQCVSRLDMRETVRQLNLRNLVPKCFLLLFR